MPFVRRLVVLRRDALPLAALAAGVAQAARWLSPDCVRYSDGRTSFQSGPSQPFKVKRVVAAAC